MNQEDAQHLQLLSIFHYVMAGLAGLMALFPFLHLVIFGMVLRSDDAQDDPMARLFLGTFMGATVLVILGGLAFAVCLALAGRFLALRMRYTFCLVVAAIACVFFPLGTVLGVFTILVLVRPSVKEAFDGGAGGGAAVGAEDR